MRNLEKLQMVGRGLIVGNELKKNYPLWWNMKQFIELIKCISYFRRAIQHLSKWEDLLRAFALNKRGGWGIYLCLKYLSEALSNETDGSVCPTNRNWSTYPSYFQFNYECAFLKINCTCQNGRGKKSIISGYRKRKVRNKSERVQMGFSFNSPWDQLVMVY